MRTINKPTKNPCSYTRHLHVSSLNCDSTCFHLLKHRNSVWFQSLKMTATKSDCARLIFAQQLLSPCIACFIGHWHFVTFSFTGTSGTVALWTWDWFYSGCYILYIKKNNNFFLSSQNPFKTCLVFCRGRDLKWHGCLPGTQTTLP